MQCPECGSQHIRKNGNRRGKQNHICVNCGRQFIDHYQPRGYSDDVKRLCLRMYVNGIGIRGIARVTGIAHTTIINWIKQTESLLPDVYDPDETPRSENSMNLKRLSALKKTRYGFGQSSTISKLAFWVGL